MPKKKVIIVGATGSLAQYVIAALSDKTDVELTLFVRSRTALAPDLVTRYRVIEGNALNYPDIKTAIAGQDIAYINLAGDLKTMSENIVMAMTENNVRRVIAISSIGIYSRPLKPVLVPYRQLADTIEQSGLDYTILRPDWFTNADEIDYALTSKGQPEAGGPISRKSIASFIASIITDPGSHKNENLGISKPN